MLPWLGSIDRCDSQCDEANTMNGAIVTKAATVKRLTTASHAAILDIFILIARLHQSQKGSCRILLRMSRNNLWARLEFHPIRRHYCFQNRCLE